MQGGFCPAPDNCIAGKVTSGEVLLGPMKAVNRAKGRSGEAAKVRDPSGMASRHDHLRDHHRIAEPVGERAERVGRHGGAVGLPLLVIAPRDVVKGEPMSVNRAYPGTAPRCRSSAPCRCCRS